MYELKLRKYCRTELSRFIFTPDMLDRLYDMFACMFDMFLKHFKGNEAFNAKIIMMHVVETTILLALETKDTRFDELANKFIIQDYPSLNLTSAARPTAQ